MGTLVQVEDRDRIRRALDTVLRRRGDLSIQWGCTSDEISVPVSIAQMALTINGDRLPGEFWVDSEPVAFDDLIEVRTGGDMALGVTLDPQEDLDLSAQTVAMWPLRVVDLHQYLEGQLQPFLEGMESTPHIILASAGSPIEEQLSMSWGYRPLSKWGGNLRRYCPDRFWASMRQEILLREADRVRIERERQEQRLNSFRVTATLQNSATMDASYFTISRPQYAEFNEVLDQTTRSMRNFNAVAQQMEASRWMPIAEDDVDPDEEPDVDYHDDIDDDDYDYDEEG